MATTVLKSPSTFTPPPVHPCNADSAFRPHQFSQLSFVSNRFWAISCRIRHGSCNRTGVKFTGRPVRNIHICAADGEAAGGSRTETREKDSEQGSKPEPAFEESIDDEVDAAASSESYETVAYELRSELKASLDLYKEALANNDESKVAEIELFLKSIEDDKIDLEKKVASLSEELSYEKDRVLRIIADFDNFRKRTERDRLSLVTNARGDVVESLLPIMDNFERAKAQIKVETEGEEKINNSYQSISKQFEEILASLGVVPVETVGKPFDPMLHEAIMREESTEHEDGIILQEFRKGFLLSERLLRPSMVKVSSGPGPTKPETGSQSEDQKEGSGNGTSETAPGGEQE